MRKISFILLLLVFALLTACSSKEETSNSEEKKAATETKEEKKNDEAVSVDKGLLNVEVTLPPSFLEGEDIDTVIANAKTDGVKEVIKNEDGTLTYKMSKSKHKEMMQELETNIKETIEETKTSGEFPSIKDVSHNSSFSEFTLVVDKAGYENSFDGFVALGFGMSGMMYQVFNGADNENVKVTVFVKDEATQEVFGEVVYPDALEEETTN